MVMALCHICCKLHLDCIHCASRNIKAYVFTQWNLSNTPFFNFFYLTFRKSLPFLRLAKYLLMFLLLFSYLIFESTWNLFQCTVWGEIELIIFFSSKGMFRQLSQRHVSRPYLFHRIPWLLSVYMRPYILTESTWRSFL